jgi:cytochrome P450
MKMDSIYAADSKIPYALWACGSAVVLYIVCLISYRIVLHPLAKYPGPFLGKFSTIRTNLSIIQENRTLMHYEMFKKYGSPFRMSTNELIFGDMESWSDIYGQSSNPCLKDPGLYDLFTVTGERNVLNATNRSQHARLRRLTSYAFSLKGLLRSESIFQARVENFMRVVIGESKGKTIDIYDHVQEHYLDITSQLSFGKSYDCLLGKSPNALADVQSFFTFIPATAFFPGLRYLPFKAIKEGFKGVKRLQNSSRSSVEDAVQKHKNGDPNLEGSLLQNLVTAVDPESGANFRIDELVENAIIFIVAGTGTTAVTTSYFIWECGRAPRVREKLVDEIRTAFPDPDIIPTYEEASKLVGLSNTLYHARCRVSNFCSN